LRVVFGDRPVLREINLSVEAGETVAIMGASGGGKSTLMRAMVGLIKPDHGDVRLDGESLAGAGAARLREIRRKVGMLFQGNALFDSMDVFDNIGFILREVRGMTPREIKPHVYDLLERLRLGPIGRMFPAELSGGMKKRVGIARAVAHDPKIVFYDDPTAGLDPITSEVIADMIAELGGRKDQTVVVMSNYLPLVTLVAHRVALLHRGRIIDLGPPQNLSESERPELRAFLDSREEK
jgi:phospholipid/cholesterol/gamma-HCH transport system ATP-binding protein